MTQLHDERSSRSADVLAENSMVVLVEARETKMGVLPIGARGVVHDAMPDGSAYLVEFSNSFVCVIQVPEAAVRRG